MIPNQEEFQKITILLRLNGGSGYYRNTSSEKSKKQKKIKILKNMVYFLKILKRKTSQIFIIALIQISLMEFLIWMNLPKNRMKKKYKIY
jgi:hypothetical protein